MVEDENYKLCGIQGKAEMSMRHTFLGKQNRQRPNVIALLEVTIMFKRTFFLSLSLSVVLFVVRTCLADATAEFDQARVFEKNKLYDQAEGIYKTILQNYPNTIYAFEAQSKLAIAYVEMGKTVQAEASIGKLIVDFSGNSDLPKTLYFIAKRWYKLGWPERTRNLYQRLIQEYPESTYAKRARLDMAAEDLLFLSWYGKEEEIRASLDKFIEKFSGNSDLSGVLYDIARQCKEKQRYEIAKNLYQLIVRQYPDSSYAPEAQLNIPKMDIWSFIDAGRYEEAETAVENLIGAFSDHPSLPPVLHGIATRYQMAKQYEKAKNLYQKIIQQYPDSFEASRAQLDIIKCDNILPLMDSGNYVDVLTNIDDLVAKFSTHRYLPQLMGLIEEEYYTRAVRLKKQGSSDEAQKHFQQAAIIAEKAMNLFASSLYVRKSYFRAGECYTQLGEYEKAKSIYQQIIQRCSGESASRAQLKIARLNSLSLSLHEQEKPISFFESQHRNWLGVKSGVVQYKIKARSIQNGEFKEMLLPFQSGSLEFLVTPLDASVKLQGPAKVQARLFNDQKQSTLLVDDVFDPETSSWLWRNDSNTPSDEEITKIKKITGQMMELFFLPIDFMAKTYPEGIWQNKFMVPKERFFVDLGLPIRHSTADETARIFANEPQYLFLSSYIPTDAKYWFSAVNGELRQIDVISPQYNIVRNCRYENYIQQQGQDIKFPQHLVLTVVQNEGGNTSSTGEELTVDFSNLQLNADVSMARLAPPQNAISLRKGLY